MCLFVIFRFIPNSIWNIYRALLRHGISIWIDVPLEMVARGEMEDQIQLAVTDSVSDSEVLFCLGNL